ncbi:MAG: sigma-70 family RNA polymerase sigma factor [Thermoanaerobaculia bacterium]|nr:MAG: sigma-70 family RNA polymerase sigma factor [Thermoanaerobaculia bacterium]MBZ0102457.1 sigma-70 family RNA polymerase sigma factor [Thermoanaerobaculia bacterium]
MPAAPASPVPLHAIDDLALVRRMAQRDPSALAALYDRFGGLLLGVARRILGPAAESEEVLQESFLQAWIQAERYDPGRSSVSTWLVLIARSRALDRLRTRKSRQRTAEAAAAETLPETSGQAESNVLQTERRRRVRAALAELPEEQRQVLELAFWEGLSQTEIATRTGAPLGTVKTRALLGMKKLRQQLRDEVRELM